jgi:hypothetical protein
MVKMLLIVAAAAVAVVGCAPTSGAARDPNDPAMTRDVQEPVNRGIDGPGVGEVPGVPPDPRLRGPGPGGP